MQKILVLVIFPICNLIALEIREPLIDEIPVVAQLFHDCWHATYNSNPTPMAPYYAAIRTPENCRSQWYEYYNKRDHFILIAIAQQEIIGVVYAGTKGNDCPQACISYDSEIDKLYVLSSRKNQGVGTELLQHALQKLQLSGFKAAIVRSLTKNEQANRFYEKRGGKFIAQPTVEFNEKMNIYGFQLNKN
ncbi:GNAT family N-acetyltransferase [Candidatus Dependentiae bacterium]|nr:GNAT family N-acetyltransferase [Candidatus Dependentiae bacterium]